MPEAIPTTMNIIQYSMVKAEHFVDNFVTATSLRNNLLNLVAIDWSQVS